MSRHAGRPTICLFAFLALLLMVACEGIHSTKLYQHGAVVSSSPIASQLGCDVLKNGGNAFDAAVVVGLTLAVTYPEAGNIGGGGFAVLRNAESGEIEALDFRETAPRAASPDMFLDSTGAVRDSLSTCGVLAAGVPGTVAGLHELWRRHGSLTWEELVTHAARLADTGFIVDSSLSARLTAYRKDLERFGSTKAVYLPGGRAPQPGERFILTDLAGTLYAIAAGGPSAFYKGPVAEKIVACQQAYGGLITLEDLAGYQPIWRQPIHFRFDSLDIYTMPPPSSGGIIMGQMLKLLEPYEFATYTPDSPEYIHLFCEAARLAYADRAVHLGDPGYWTIPTVLLDDKYLDERREHISLTAAGSSQEIEAGNPNKYESDQTTHFSICDDAGNLVSITTTLNTGFGSKLVVDGAGFLLNNEMDDFSIKPGHANTYGLVGGEANRIEPGKRPLSSMTPTLVFCHDQPVLVLGAPGGSKIPTTVTEAILNLTRFGLSLDETVSAPRFHHQWMPDTIYVEAGGFHPETLARLRTMGHAVMERPPYSDLQLIWIEPSGLMAGASDPRGPGKPAGY